jgi:hypothetical protein
MLNRPRGKCLAANLWKISKERSKIIFRFVGTNGIYDGNLLLMLPLAEATNIQRLEEVSQIGGELN